MGMNNSDFISEAVALDLGKSGVKVAETLEIEVGSEWWRLINAADVMDVTRYNYRKLADPVVVDGVLNLAPFGSKSIPMLLHSGSTIKTIPQFPMGLYCPLDGETPNIAGTLTIPYTTQWETVSKVSVNNVLHDIRAKSSYSFNSYNDYFEICSLWDSINNRWVSAYDFIGAIASDYLPVIFTNVGGAGNFSSITSGLHNNMRGRFAEARCFSHEPAIVYKAYKDSTGALWVDYIPFVSSETPTNFRDRLLKPSVNAYKLTGADAAEHEVGLFYSRWHGSVGVLWRDATSGICMYALKIENWADAHALPNFLTSKHSISRGTVGTLAIPNNGEFLIVGTEKTQKGTIGRPVGYSFPAGLHILGAESISVGKSVLLGIVGTTLIRYEVDTSTMQILQYTSVDTGGVLDDAASVRESQLIFRMIRRTSTCEYWIGEGFPGVALRSAQVHLARWVFCFTAEGVYKWGFDVGYGTSIFADGAAGAGYGRAFGGDMEDSSRFGGTMIHNLGNTYLFLARQFLRSAYTTKLLNCTVPFSVLDSCADADAVIAQLPVMNISTAFSTYIIGGSGTPGNLYIEDDGFYYFIYKRVPGFGGGSNWHVFTVNKSNLQIDTVRINVFSSVDGFCFVPSKFSNGCYSHHFNDGDICAISTGILQDGKMCLTFFKSTMASGSVISKGEIIVNAHQYSKGVTSTQAHARPSHLVNVFSTNPAHPIWGLVGVNSNELGFAGVDLTNAVERGVFSSRYSLTHAHARFLANSSTAEVWSISDITGGEIYYEKFQHAGKEREDFAIDVTGSVAKINFGAMPGRVQSFRTTGDMVTAITGGGSNWIFETGASSTEGEGVTPPSEEESAILYTYVSQNFTPYPFAREGIRAELSNISKTTKITLPETRTNLIRGLLASGTDFRGSRCILRRIFPDHADAAGSDIVLLDGYIQDWSYVPGKKGIAFTVSKTLIDVGAQFPKRLMNMGCSHVFKGARCQYLGEEGRCLKTKTFCASLANQLQFGGFPWVAARQRRVMWK